MGVKTLLSSSNYNLQFQLREQMHALDFIPYNIQIDKLNLRAAVSGLFQTTEQFLAHCSVITNQTIDFINPVSMMWNYNGPQSGIKLIAVIRHIATKKPKNPNLKQVRFFYGSVLQVDLDQNVIDPIVIFERVDSLQNKIRGFAVHPTGKQLVIVSEKKIQQFFLVKSQDNKREYKLTLHQQKPINYTCTDLKYHPSGQYLLAMSLKGTEIRPVKIDAKSLQITGGPDLNKKCLNASQIVYRKKDIFAVDRNNPSVAAACHNSSKVCIFDIENLNENQSVLIKQIQIQINNTITNFHKPQLDWDQTRLFTRIGVINQTKQSKYVLYQPTYQIASMFTLSQNDRGLSFSYQKYNQKNTDPRFTSCIEIPDINSLCCYHENYYIFQITKLDLGTNVSYSLGQVETSDMKPAVAVFDVESMFYYENNSEICMIINQVIFCFPIKTMCTSNTSKTLISNCYSICRQQNKYWNPISMRCEDCTENCICTKATHSFNPYYNSCMLDCQKIPKASPIAVYANSTKCVCEHSFSWIEQKQMCQANCTNVKYSLGAHPDRVFQCKCQTNFVFHPFDQTFQAPGQCILTCENGQPSLVNQGKPSCKCGVFQQWNDSTNSCIRLQSIFTLPIWLIVLISILSVVLVGLLIFCIYKIKKRKIKADELKKQEENIRDRPFNDFNLNIQPVLNRNISEIIQERISQIETNRQIYSNSNSGSAVSLQHAKKQCCICEKETKPGVNIHCKSDCGHNFHFQCLKNQIDSHQCYKCQECDTYINLQNIRQITKQEREGILQINSNI